jgi:hypothetical protein
MTPGYVVFKRAKLFAFTGGQIDTTANDGNVYFRETMDQNILHRASKILRSDVRSLAASSPYILLISSRRPSHQTIHDMGVLSL